MVFSVGDGAKSYLYVIDSLVQLFYLTDEAWLGVFAEKCFELKTDGMKNLRVQKEGV
jgi:hypothetical protein